MEKKMRVLVPLDAMDLFKTASVRLSPISYSISQEPFLRRAFRKGGLISAEKTLSKKLTLSSRLDDLTGVEAFWLSPNAYFTTKELSSFVDKMPNLRWVYCQMTGLDRFDLNSFRSKKVLVSNAGTLSSQRVAELALACMVSHIKRLPQHLFQQKARIWRSLSSREFDEITVGILGTGNIGGCTAKLCKVMGMQVIGLSRTPQTSAPPGCYDQMLRLPEETDRFLERVDILVVALPLNEKTKNFLNSSRIAKLKETSVVINVARGLVVDEKSLCKALKEGKVAAAYIDVPSRVPPGRFSRLYRTPNLYLTHYSGANNPFTRRDAFNRFITGVDALRKNEDPMDVVNRW